MDVQGAAGRLNKHTLRGRLRRAGLRVTLARLEVLSALHRMGGHRSADEIAAELKRRGAQLPRASVYNALRVFVQAGLVQQADVGAGRAVFETADQWHHHFICRSCGAILDIPCVEGEKPCLTPSVEGLQVDEAQIIFRGICPSCSGAHAKTPRRKEA